MNTLSKAVLACLTIGCSASALAKVEISVAQNELELSGLNEQQKYSLRLALPNQDVQVLNVHNAQAMIFTAADFGVVALPDGQYTFELVPVNAHQISDKSGGNRVSDKAGAIQLATESGVFTVENGATVIDQDEATRDQQILDDLIVDGSACIGMDCVNGENFGFDTLRLKENNLRIKFDDTSNSGSFPNVDWQLTANETNNGGLNKFSIDDTTNNKTPFTIEAAAPNNTLYVEADGDVGIKTNNPVVDLHIVEGNTPTLRLEQDGSDGFNAQIWDVAGNETTFFVRDVTHSSALPFRMEAGTPDSSVRTYANGQIQLGNGNTTQVRIDAGKMALGSNTTNNNLYIVEQTGNAGIVLENVADANAQWKFVNKNGDSFEIAKSGTGGSEFRVWDDGRMQVINTLGASPGTNFDMDAGGNVAIRGTLSQGSDVNSKENIASVDTASVLAKVMDLPIATWNYKFDNAAVQHMGPMAQDFFSLFGLGSDEKRIGTLDTAGVALASIKELGHQVNAKDAKIERLEQENAQLNQRLEALEQAIAKLQQN